MSSSAIFAILLGVAQAAPSVPSAPPAEQGTIVVTAVRLSDSERALKECIKQHCPPDQDIKATLAHAENQFVAGDYSAARATLLAARGRNKRYAGQYPVPVSDLLRANARVAAHLGLGTQERTGYLDTYDALKAGLSPDDPRVLQARLDVADAFARFSDIDSAQVIYHDVARRAQKLNLSNVRGFALLRSAVLFAAMNEASHGQYQASTIKACDEIINDPDTRLAPFADAARLLKAKAAAKRGDSGAIDALIEHYRQSGATDHVVLIDSPLIDLQYNATPPQPNAASLKLPGDSRFFESSVNFEDQWIDVAFYVTPAGGVSDADVVRTSPRLRNQWWVPRVLASVNKRRYAPLKRDPNDPGILRVERFTLTSRVAPANTGSHIVGRSGQPRVETLDLSPT